MGPALHAAAVLARLAAWWVSLGYRNRRPTRFGHAQNRLWGSAVALGLVPAAWAGEPPWGPLVLEVRGRRSGRLRSTVLTWVEHDGERYLVSMLGEGSHWVRNVRAAGGEATLRCGRRRGARLEEVPAARRGPILRAYLRKTAIATRAHFGVDPQAAIGEFERIAPRHPVFRIVT